MEKYLKEDWIINFKEIITKDKEKMENIFHHSEFNIKELSKIINLMD